MAVFGYEDPNAYLGINDEDFVERARCGDERAIEFLMWRYRALVETKARTFFVMGADHEDVVQEGMIGLCKAIRDFRGERKAKFKPFAELCVTRQIITAVKTATRQKHFFLNGYVSLDQSLGTDDRDGVLLDVIADQNCVNPEEAAISDNIPKNIQEEVKHLLSDLEAIVLQAYLDGKTYREMSVEFHCRSKCIDNALQRVKKKICSLLEG